MYSFFKNVASRIIVSSFLFTDSQSLSETQRPLLEEVNNCSAFQLRLAVRLRPSMDSVADGEYTFRRAAVTNN